MTYETRRRIEELRAELHELYKQAEKQPAKIDAIAEKIRKLREADSEHR